VAELGARLVVAGTHSGVGKTTVATGLMAAFARRGVAVASAKVGPDFIDPGYHALATGRPGRNLDPWMCGADAIGPLAGRAAKGADLLLIEGVMGLFDGAADGTPSSTADVARMLDAPVVLVVDTAAMSQSVAALVHGFATLQPDVRIGGVILNQVASPAHEDMLRQALLPVGIPVLGLLGRDPALTWRDRHLGLVPVVEDTTAVVAAIDVLAAAVARGCQLDDIESLAHRAPKVVVGEPSLPEPAGRARVAVAAGPAFSFSYTDNLEALAAAGAELMPFDPCADPSLPPGCQALVAGGGFPEVFAAQLSANRPLLGDVRRRILDEDLVVWAECGGLLWLANHLDGQPMVGVIAAEAHMTDRLTLGYRSAETTTASPLGPPGCALRGHEFHYSDIAPSGDALRLVSRRGTATGGFAGPRLLASYLHVHLGSTPDVAAAFVRTASTR
jgi:cobyrinic acid a,c-diamide synthase